VLGGATQSGKSIVRWARGEGVHSTIEFWDNTHDVSNSGYGTVEGLLGIGPDAVYHTMDVLGGESVWYLPAKYPPQYSFGRHLQLELGGNVRMLGLHNGTASHSVGEAEGFTDDVGGVINHMRIAIDNDVDAGAWDSYLLANAAGRYFYKSLECHLPTQSVFAFPHDSPLHFVTKPDDLVISTYLRDQLIIAVPDPVNRQPRYETSVTLVYCDRWISQDTSTMYRREERSKL
jgi:hypothetical protein